LLCFPKKPYTLVGFESGSSIPEADVMFTLPHLAPILQPKQRSIRQSRDFYADGRPSLGSASIGLIKEKWTIKEETNVKGTH
jgi:hypothetical protein